MTITETSVLITNVGTDVFDKYKAYHFQAEA